MGDLRWSKWGFWLLHAALLCAVYAGILANHGPNGACVPPLPVMSVSVRCVFGRMLMYPMSGIFECRCICVGLSAGNRDTVGPCFHSCPATWQRQRSMTQVSIGLIRCRQQQVLCRQSNGIALVLRALTDRLWSQGLLPVKPTVVRYVAALCSLHACAMIGAFLLLVRVQAGYCVYGIGEVLHNALLPPVRPLRVAG